jgi:predicted nucleic acid-binding protein
VKWLLDTNVVSEGVRDRPNRAVLAWLADKPSYDLAISVITLAELVDGATSSRDEIRRRNLNTWIETQVSETFRDRVLSLTTDILAEWLRMTRQLRVKGQTRDAADLLIAATAQVHKLTLVTRNVRHFASTGITVHDPWNGKTQQMEAP